MKTLIVCLMLVGCAGYSEAQKKQLSDDAYKACKVVVQVHEALGEAGSEQ